MGGSWWPAITFIVVRQTSLIGARKPPVISLIPSLMPLLTPLKKRGTRISDDDCISDDPGSLFRRCAGAFPSLPVTASVMTTAIISDGSLFRRCAGATRRRPLPRQAWPPSIQPATPSLPWRRARRCRRGRRHAAQRRTAVGMTTSVMTASVMTAVIDSGGHGRAYPSPTSLTYDDIGDDRISDEGACGGCPRAIFTR